MYAQGVSTAALHDFAALVRRIYEIERQRNDASAEELRRFIGLTDGLELPTFDPAQKEEPAQPPAGLCFRDNALEGADAAFAAPLRALKTDFWWTTFYAESDWSRPFFANFAAGEIVAPGCAVPRDDLVVGVVSMGLHTFYPAHAHPAVEVYTALAGKSRFRAGGGAC